MHTEKVVAPWGTKHFFTMHTAERRVEERKPANQTIVILNLQFHSFNADSQRQRQRFSVRPNFSLPDSNPAMTKCYWKKSSKHLFPSSHFSVYYWGDHYFPWRLLLRWLIAVLVSRPTVTAYFSSSWLCPCLWCVRSGKTDGRRGLSAWVAVTVTVYMHFRKS